MNRFFYPRLALTNMKKHRKTYVPYLLSSIITVSMFYILTGLTYNFKFVFLHCLAKLFQITD